jgi:6-pyruvoyltetrahydropterin/6-carboxytetrahydropterin synthase
MYEITTEDMFSAAHHLNNYHGPCENIHGHNWRVRTTVRCSELNESGIGIDFRVLREKLSTILNRLDHADLNQVFAAEKIHPSSEQIAWYIHRELKIVLEETTCRIYKVEVFETPGNSASYIEEYDD